MIFIAMQFSFLRLPGHILTVGAVFVFQAGLFEDALTLLKKQEEKSSDLNRLDRSGLALIHIACASGAMVNILLPNLNVCQFRDFQF